MQKKLVSLVNIHLHCDVITTNQNTTNMSYDPISQAGRIRYWETENKVSSKIILGILSCLYSMAAL